MSIPSVETKTPPSSPISDSDVKVLSSLPKQFCYCNRCSLEAKCTIITKRGDNYGKMYYMCANKGKVTKDSCDFNYIEGRDDDLDKMKSKCPSGNHQAVKRRITNKSSKNFGKWYWSCECSKQFEVVET